MTDLHQLDGTFFITSSTESMNDKLKLFQQKRKKQNLLISTWNKKGRNESFEQFCLNHLDTFDLLDDKHKQDCRLSDKVISLTFEGNAACIFQHLKQTAPSYTIFESSNTIRTALYQYASEIRHLPLYRFLQTSPIYFPTEAWIAARDELRFSKVFERIAELKLANAWSPAFKLNSHTILEQEGTGIFENCCRDVILSGLCINPHEMKYQLQSAHDFLLKQRNWRLFILRQIANDAVEWKRKNRFKRLSNEAQDQIILFYDKALFERQLIIGSLTTQEHLGDFHELNHLHDISINPRPISSPWTLRELFYIKCHWKLLNNLSPNIRMTLIQINCSGSPKRHPGEFVELPAQTEVDESSLLRQICISKQILFRQLHSNESKMNPDPKTIAPQCTIRKTKITGVSTQHPGSPASEAPVMTTITFNVHPSHDTAIRKANLVQTVTGKPATPGELALRRIQKIHAAAAQTHNQPSQSAPAMSSPLVMQQQTQLQQQAGRAQAPSMMIFRPTYTSMMNSATPIINSNIHIPYPTVIQSGAPIIGGYAFQASQNNNSFTPQQGQTFTSLSNPVQNPLTNSQPPN